MTDLTTDRQRDRRIARRRALLTQRLAAAQGPTGRVAAATDFLRAAIAKAPTDQAEAAADRAVASLRELGERLLTGAKAGDQR